MKDGVRLENISHCLVKVFVESCRFQLFDEVNYEHFDYLCYNIGILKMKKLCLLYHLLGLLCAVVWLAQGPAHPA